MPGECAGYELGIRLLEIYLAESDVVTRRGVVQLRHVGRGGVASNRGSRRDIRGSVSQLAAVDGAARDDSGQCESEKRQHRESGACR